MVQKAGHSTIQGTIIFLRDVFCNYVITDSGGKVSISFQHIKKITHITALCRSNQPVCQTLKTSVGYQWRSCEKRFKHTSGSLRASSSAWWGDDRKDKRGKQRDGGGGDMTRQLGSLLPCLSQRDKSWLFIGLSVSPAFYWVRGDHTKPDMRHRSKWGFKQIGSRYPTLPGPAMTTCKFQILNISWMTAVTLVFIAVQK